MSTTAVPVENGIAEGVHKALSYYSVFSYPLRLAEIHKYCPATDGSGQVLAYLQEQVRQQRIFAHKDFYTLLPNVEELVARREQANRRAEQAVAEACHVGRLLYCFPFVRFIGISGSLSKGYADHKSDFDFFIVTAEKRLWICRSLLHLFKKFTFLTGQQHKFCMNYFVDESRLRLDERNIYTATELSSLIPICGEKAYTDLMLENDWMLEHVPNFALQQVRKNDDNRSGLKALWEWLFNHLAPAALNRFLMRFTDKRWRKKWAARDFPMSDYALAFKTSVHVSKNHPANYQKKILERLAAKDQ